jgi:hypothetical protein
LEDNIKRYKFSCGLEASQEELTLEQDYRIMDLIKSVNLSDLSNTTIADLIKTLSENKLVEKFLSIIFSINDEELVKSFSKLKNSELKEVVTDFFILNPIALDLLRALRSAADITTMSPQSSDSDVMQEDLTQAS